MDKKDYISGNLYKMTRNNADFNSQAAAVQNITSAAEPVNTMSKAQERRLSDVYNAKLDLMARMERAAGKLNSLNDELEKTVEARRRTASVIMDKLEKLKNLTEPEGGRELHEYLREVEHLRMEYFRMESEIEHLSNAACDGGAAKSFWEELSEQKSSHLMKLGLVTMFPVIIAMIIGALIVGAAVIAAMKI